MHQFDEGAAIHSSGVHRSVARRPGSRSRPCRLRRRCCRQYRGPFRPGYDNAPRSAAAGRLDFFAGGNLLRNALITASICTVRSQHPLFQRLVQGVQCLPGERLLAARCRSSAGTASAARSVSVVISSRVQRLGVEPQAADACAGRSDQRDRGIGPHRGRRRGQGAPQPGSGGYRRPPVGGAPSARAAPGLQPPAARPHSPPPAQTRRSETGPGFRRHEQGQWHLECAPQARVLSRTQASASGGSAGAARRRARGPHRSLASSAIAAHP